MMACVSRSAVLLVPRSITGWAVRVTSVARAVAFPGCVHHKPQQGREGPLQHKYPQCPQSEDCRQSDGRPWHPMTHMGLQ